MKPASRCTIAMDIVRCATLAEPRKPTCTAAGLSGIEFQSSFDLVSFVQIPPASEVCYCMRSSRYASIRGASRLEMPRIRVPGSFRLIELREARIKHMRPIVEAWRLPVRREY